MEVLTIIEEGDAKYKLQDYRGAIADFSKTLENKNDAEA